MAQLAVHGGPNDLGWTVGLTALTVAALLVSLSGWAGRGDVAG